MVVHIFESTQGTTHTNVPAAIAALNRAFDGSFGVNTNIRFCLAQRAPDGGITSGVNRIKSGYENFDMDLEDAKLKANLQWDPRHYLNIWGGGSDLFRDHRYLYGPGWLEKNRGGEVMPLCREAW